MHYHNIPGLVVSVTSTCRADNAGSNRFRAKRYNKVGQHRPSQSFACLLEVFYPLGIRSVIGQKCETVSPKNPMMMDGVVATSSTHFFLTGLLLIQLPHVFLAYGDACRNKMGANARQWRYTVTKLSLQQYFRCSCTNIKLSHVYQDVNFGATNTCKAGIRNARG